MHPYGLPRWHSGNAGDVRHVVRSLGWEDPIGKEMATNSSILAWEIPWTEEPGELQSMGSKRVGYDFATTSPPPPPQHKTGLPRCHGGRLVNIEGLD